MATPRSTQRLLLKDWLIKQLDNNVYSSCKWVDRDQMTFFVPWMHQSRHEFDKAEAQIFEDWSRASGYWKKTETTAQWKTRFRCAMSKSPYIKELKDFNVDDGFQQKRLKVFQIIDTKNKKSPVSLLMETVSKPNLVLSEPTGQPQNTEYATLVDVDNTSYETDSNMEIMLDGSSELVTADDLAVMHGLKLYPELLDNLPLDPSENIYMEETTSDQEKANLVHITDEKQRQTQQSQPVHTVKVEGTVVDDTFQVDILYFGQLSTTYRNDEKCHLYDRSDSDSGSGERLPLMEPFLKNKDEKLVKRAQEILDPKNIKGGLLLEYDKGDIWATRHCLTHIFYSNFFTQPPNECPKLVRNRRTKIFSQDEFEGSHKEFQNGSSRLPSNEVYLGFALRCYFSDPKRNSLPISAIVKSRRSQHDLDMAKGLENRMESLKISESVEQNASAVNDNMAGLQPPFISATINSPIPGSHQAQSLNYTLSSMMPNTTVATQQASSQMPAIAQPNHQMLPQYLQNLSPVSPAQSYSQQVRSPVMPMVQSPQAALQNRGTF